MAYPHATDLSGPLVSGFHKVSTMYEWMNFFNLLTKLRIMDCVILIDTNSYDMKEKRSWNCIQLSIYTHLSCLVAFLQALMTLHTFPSLHTILTSFSKESFTFLSMYLARHFTVLPKLLMQSRKSFGWLLDEEEKLWTRRWNRTEKIFCHICLWLQTQAESYYPSPRLLTTCWCCSLLVMTLLHQPWHV
jgi:hypothetical protein